MKRLRKTKWRLHQISTDIVKDETWCKVFISGDNAGHDGGQCEAQPPAAGHNPEDQTLPKEGYRGVALTNTHTKWKKE